MAADSEMMIDTKSKELSSRIKWAAILSGVGGAVPVPGVSMAIDMKIMVDEGIFQKKQLGIDDDSIKKKAASVGANKENILKMVNQEIKKDKDSSILRLLVDVMAENEGNQAAKLVTGLAAAVAAKELAESAVK